MIAYLFTGLFVLILISAALAPLESLGWWAGWFGEHEAPGTTPEQPETTADPARPAKQVTSYLVYLSGIGAIDGTSIPSEESVFLEMLRTHVPGALLVSDVFPYSVTNAGLTSRRVGKRVFAWVEQRRLNNPLAVEQLIINLRNMFQVAVSADQRYGPIYNLGVAREIVRAIEKEGDGIIKGVPISILGWSGGGQIALGAAPFLRSMLRAPVRIISVGGVMSDDPGLDSVEHVYHYLRHQRPDPGHRPEAVRRALEVLSPIALEPGDRAGQDNDDLRGAVHTHRYRELLGSKNNHARRPLARAGYA